MILFSSPSSPSLFSFLTFFPLFYLFDFSFCLFELDAIARNYLFFDSSDFRYLKYVLMKNSEMQKVEGLQAKKKCTLKKKWWLLNIGGEIMNCPKGGMNEIRFSIFTFGKTDEVLKELHATLKFFSCSFFPFFSFSGWYI